MDEVRMEKVHKALNYANFFTVKAKANGLAGGLLLLWTDDIDLHCEKISENFLKCIVKGQADNVCWSFFPCYGTPYRGEKMSL